MDKTEISDAITKFNRLNAGTLQAKIEYAQTYPKFREAWQQCRKEVP